MSRRGQRGFTLIELIIVIAIIVVMSGIVAPSLLGAIPGIRVSGAAREVLADFRLARTKAVERGLPAVVEFTDATALQYRIFLDKSNPPNGAYDDGTDQLIRSVTLSREYTGLAFRHNDTGTAASGLNLPDGDTDHNKVSFRPNGSASGAGEVYLMPAADEAAHRTDRNRRVQIVAETGFTELQSYSGSAWE